MVDLEKQAILHNEKTVPLSQADMRLLFVFLNNPRQILSFQDIILMKDSVDLPVKEAQSKLRPMIQRLRARLADVPGSEEWIESVRGVGYVFNN
jgi:two-component system OmpR family response regulator